VSLRGGAGSDGYARDMAYLLVLLLAAAAGAGVGVATYRSGARPRSDPSAWSRGYEAEPEPEAVEPSPADATASSRRPLPDDPTTESRVIGAVGLFVVCLVAAGAIVGALFAAYLAVRGAFGG
jgi:hypothetical protein